MIGALVRGIADLRDARIRAALVAIVLWTVALFAAVLALLLVGIGSLNPGAWAAGLLPGWLANVIAGVLAVAGFAMLLWFLFVFVAHNVAACFHDRVVARVEEINYPELPPAPGLGLADSVTDSIRFTALLVAVNLVAAPIYLVGLLVPVVSLVLFYLVNGWLVGREYADIVILRRLSRAQAADWRKSHRRLLFVAGVVITFTITIPVVNLLAPVLGAAFATHLFHGTRAREAR